MTEQSEFEEWINKTYPGRFCYHHKTAANYMLKGWKACAERKDERIAKLTDKLFALGAMDEAPCFHCGYSGEGYFNPDKHPCAARHYGETE